VPPRGKPGRAGSSGAVPSASGGGFAVRGPIRCLRSGGGPAGTRGLGGRGAQPDPGRTPRSGKDDARAQTAGKPPPPLPRGGGRGDSGGGGMWGGGGVDDPPPLPGAAPFHQRPGTDWRRVDPSSGGSHARPSRSALPRRDPGIPAGDPGGPSPADGGGTSDHH